MVSLYNPQFLLKTLFRHAPVLSNDPLAIQTAPVLKKRSSIPLSPPACKPYGLEAEPEANIQGFRRKTPRPSYNYNFSV
jgi:hypothetical protein